MDVFAKGIYTDLDEMPIYNFNKCVSGNMRFIYESKRGSETRVTLKSWNKMYNEYCGLTNTNETLRYYKLIGEVQYLTSRAKIAPMLITSLLKLPTIQVLATINELKEWGLVIDYKKPLKEEVNKCLQILTNSSNKLNRKLGELDEIKNKPEGDITLQAQKAKLHRLLSINVDIMTTSVTEWLAYWKEVEQLSKKQ